MQDYLGYLKLARSLASAQNLSIKFEDESTAMPRTDGRTLYLPRPNPLWSAKDWSIWNDACWHEIGHNFPENRDIFKELKAQKIDCSSLFGIVLNLTDDYRVDKTRTKRYYGMMEANAVAIPHHVQGFAKKLKENPSKLRDDQGLKVVATMMTFDAKMRADFNPAMSGMDAYTESLLDAEAKAWLAKLIAEYSEKYCNNKTAKQELELVRDIFTNVFKIPPQDAGDGQGSGEGEGESESDNDESDERDGEAKSKKGKKAKFGTVSYEEWLKHPHSPEGGKPSGCRIEYSDSTSARDYQPHTDETNRIYDIAGGDKPTSRGYQALTAGYVKEAVQRMGIHAIVGAARRLLQVETRKRPHFNQKRGRLDASKLYRVTIPESSVSERLFKTKDESRALDTAVSVLVDYSGSMGSKDKIGTAAAAACALNELFRTLRVNCEILGFSEISSRNNATFVFKPFNKAVSDDSLAEYMSDASCAMCNNCDGDNILIAANRLKQQKQPRKVLIVLSDGSPCGGYGDIDGFTKQVIKKIESEREIDIIGIGIQDRNVRRLYKTNRVVNNLSDLPTKLIDTLENILLERKVK